MLHFIYTEDIQMDINEIRKALASVTTEQLQELSTEEVMALTVTLRQVLEKVQEMRTVQESEKTHGWEDLTT